MTFTGFDAAVDLARATARAVAADRLYAAATARAVAEEDADRLAAALRSPRFTNYKPDLIAASRERFDALAAHEQAIKARTTGLRPYDRTVEHDVPVSMTAIAWSLVERLLRQTGVSAAVDCADDIRYQVRADIGDAEHDDRWSCLMLPAEFLARAKAISAEHERDPKMSHDEHDDLCFEVLAEYGYGEGVRHMCDQTRWYA